MISEDYEYDESRITEDESGDSDEQIRRRLVEEQTLVEELEADAEENPFEEDEEESEEPSSVTAEDTRESEDGER